MNESSYIELGSEPSEPDERDYMSPHSPTGIVNEAATLHAELVQPESDQCESVSINVKKRRKAIEFLHPN